MANPTHAPSDLPYDVVIVGGGPAGLSAALTLGRSRRRVLLCDSGPRRNAAAVHIHNFVTRDGTAPDDFRALAREQLRAYPSVEVEDARVEAISGARGAFRVTLAARTITARRILLCTGLIDTMLPIAGFRELWGSAIFQCPYCHGWEARDQRWGYLARAEEPAHLLPFALKLRAWASEVIVFTSGTFDVPEDTRLRLQSAGVRLETAPVKRLAGSAGRLEAIELDGGAAVPCEVLFVHPPQRQIELIATLGVELDEHGFVRIDPMKRETTVSGIYAAGDLTTRLQGAIFAASAGTQAAAMINLDLAMDYAPLAARA